MFRQLQVTMWWTCLLLQIGRAVRSMRICCVSLPTRASFPAHIPVFQDLPGHIIWRVSHPETSPMTFYPHSWVAPIEGHVRHTSLELVDERRKCSWQFLDHNWRVLFHVQCCALSHGRGGSVFFKSSVFNSSYKVLPRRPRRWCMIICPFE